MSDAQSAFVRRKEILDGILIANEVVDEAKRMNKELLLFKVDFEKAYTSIDLKYLNSVMLNMNFPTLWRKWIMECVGTTSAAVLVNGCPKKEFPIQRGLRQGDPLSPFLFLLAAEGFDALMKAAVSNNIFQPYGVGAQREVWLSHLQFADDTLVLGEKSWLNVRTIRAVLLILEELSGLKVNFNKSMLTGVNIFTSWLSKAAAILNCRTGLIPFVYLGMPIVGDNGKLSFWKPVVDRISARLSSWNNKSLSSGGRLVLLKSVLSSLPVYFFSFFMAPTCIISSIESIFLKEKNWGGCEASKKIAWIKCDFVCLPVTNGGLGVRRLGEFNLSLLRKWCWRMMVDKDGLWYRVLKARYGEVGGRIKEGGRNSSRWWRSICNVREGSGLVVGRWFDDNIRRVVGNGRNTFFWSDNWLGGVPLKLQFNRLYDLSVHKECSVEDMSTARWEDGSLGWVWRRRLLAWEEESVRECVGLLNNFVLQDNIQDHWRWLLDPVHGYTVKGTYRFLTTTDDRVADVAGIDVWYNLVSSKVSLFAWRLFQDRIPTKANFVHRHVIQPTDNLCVGGCGFIETTDHLFIACNFFGSTWYLICLWLGVSWAFSGSVKDHFSQFTHLVGLLRRSHLYLKIILLACVWTIWKERNNCVFKNVVLDPLNIVEKVKLNSFLWLLSNVVPLLFGLHDWWRYRLSCMSIM